MAQVTRTPQRLPRTIPGADGPHGPCSSPRPPHTETRLVLRTDEVETKSGLESAKVTTDEFLSTKLNKSCGDWGGGGQSGQVTGHCGVKARINRECRTKEGGKVDAKTATVTW